MFSAALAGGATRPPRSCLGFLCSSLGLRPTLLKNPRTCRGQSRESKNLPRTKPRTNSVQTPTRNIIAQSFVRLNSFPYRNPPYSKNVGRRYSPPGGLQSAAQPGTACGTRTPGLRILLLISFRILLLRGSCPPPPKSSPSRPGPTPSSAAICGAGASWRLLGRKSRVPRGLQKLIKF